MEREYIRLKLRRERVEHLAHGEPARHRAQRTCTRRCARSGSGATTPSAAGRRAKRPRTAGRVVIRLAGALGFLGVALGAFGAHGLRERLAPGMLDVYKTGVLYHLLHAVALLALALGAERVARPRAVATLWAVGVVIFSGSLYALAITGVGALGAVTPIGGLLLMAGWVTLALNR